MTRYILKPAINMYDCDWCTKEFKNGRSLASHRYTYHKNQQIGSKLKGSYDGRVRDEISTIKRSRVDNQTGIVGEGLSEYESGESSSEVSDDMEALFEENTQPEKTQKRRPKLKKIKVKRRCGENENSSVNTEDSFGKHPAKRTEEEIVGSFKPIQRSESIIMNPENQEVETSAKIVKANKYKENKHLLDSKALKNLNKYNKSMINPKHAKLIKNIFKFVLNGSIPLEQHHISEIKPHRSFVRKIAHGKIGAIKKAMRSGKSILKTVLQIALPILAGELL